MLRLVLTVKHAVLVTGSPGAAALLLIATALFHLLTGELTMLSKLLTISVSFVLFTGFALLGLACLGL